MSQPIKSKKFCCKSGCDDCPYGFSSSEIDPDVPVELIINNENEFCEEPSAEELIEKYNEFNQD